MADTETKVMEKPRSGRSCFQRFKDAVSLVPRDVTPPDWGILWLVFISLFSSAFTLTFLFPFLPEMILTFGYSEEGKGTYVGLVASSVFAGRAVGSFFWGWLSDVKGRRVVLLITIFFNGFFSFLFGFSGSLPFAMAIRFLAGLANGTVGVAKTVLYDVSDNTNQAFSMSVISIAWGSGLIMGPTVGGFLAVPATKYPNVFSPQGFFADFPFILPSFCCLVVCCIVLVIVFFKFKEPKVVLNTEEVSVEANSSGVDRAGEADKLMVMVDSQHPAKQVDSCPVVVVSHPTLNRLRHESSSSPSRCGMVHMSMENLHCEADLAYYYARQHSQTSRDGGALFSPTDKSVSTSMQNLTPVAVPLISQEDGLAPVARKRSYSHGGQRTPHADAGGEFDSNTDPTLAKNGRSSVEAGVGLAGPETQVAPSDQHIGNGKVKAQRSACAEAAALLNEKDPEREGSSEEKRSALSSCWHSITHSALIRLLRIRGLRHSVVLYTVMSFAVIGFEDVFTIFASTAVEYDGLGFSTDEIGLALGAVSIPLMFIQIKLYPLMVSKFGIKRAYLINISFMFIPIQLMPMVHMLADNKVWLWVCLVVLTLPLRLAANSCFTGSSLLINNSVTSNNAGKANGVGMTCTAIARTLAPTLGGALFSWSLRMNRTVGPPLDVNLTFVFFGLVLFFSAIHCVFLPKHLDHQQK